MEKIELPSKGHSWCTGGKRQETELECSVSLARTLHMTLLSNMVREMLSEGIRKEIKVNQQVKVKD